MDSPRVTVKVDVSERSLERAVSYAKGTEAALRKYASKIERRANSMGASFKTGKYHRDHQSPAVGGTKPRYGSDVELGRKGYVGIVHPENYAAMKDNHLHNTLLKAR